MARDPTFDSTGLRLVRDAAASGCAMGVEVERGPLTPEVVDRVRAVPAWARRRDRSAEGDRQEESP